MGLRVLISLVEQGLGLGCTKRVVGLTVEQSEVDSRTNSKLATQLEDRANLWTNFWKIRLSKMLGYG